MKHYTIPIVTPELTVIFHTTPCNDVAHQPDTCLLGCRTSKTLILRDDAAFALVHSWPFIKPGYTFRGPSKGSREVLLRMRTHGDACVPSYLPEEARRSERSQKVRVEKGQTHLKHTLEVEPPGKYDHEEDQYDIVPERCQFDEDGEGNLSLATEDHEEQIKTQAEQQRPRRKKVVFYQERQRRKEEEKWVTVEKEDAEEDWEVLDGEQVQEDYWEDYFEFNGCLMGAGSSATM
ncbi:hypothetical protein PRZ48_001390 [Zasmidium cellare]|uniref:Uncharacterized protein n=1 Tax=Zasmidium cellare TaxID=395010 RepID=A0ABR0F2M5_ZASCE|nr:hypothetical protein PRZ48_001390 [Zasmidium cellare]